MSLFETPLPESYLREVRLLLDEQRDKCAWFWRRDFVPRDAAEARLALQAIARRGDRAAYARAVRLLHELESR